MNIYTYKTFIHPLVPVLNPTGLTSFHECFNGTGWTDNLCVAQRHTADPVLA